MSYKANSKIWRKIRLYVCLRKHCLQTLAAVLSFMMTCAEDLLQNLRLGGGGSQYSCFTIASVTTYSHTFIVFTDDKEVIVYSIKNNNTNNVVSYRNVNKCIRTFVDDTTSYRC